MEQVAKAVLQVEWGQDHEPKSEDIPLQYNPTELSFDKSAQIAEIAIPGLDAPLQQFVRGQAEKLTLDLFFDTTDEGGMGKNAVSVTTRTDRIYQLIKIDPKRHAPPICTFVWGTQFPGSSVGGEAGSVARRAVGAVAGEAVGATLGAVASVIGDAASAVAGAVAAIAGGNQRRNAFRCIVESVKQKFTLFSPEGIPLRATLTVTLREYKTLDDQLKQLNLLPDRTHSHVIQSGDTLASIAARLYQRSDEWRFIADANDIEDPRRLTPGAFLTIPPTR